MTKGAWTDAVTIEAKTAALDGIKWLLWHGNAMDAIEDIECLADDVDADPDENSAAVSNVGQCAEHLGAPIVCFRSAPAFSTATSMNSFATAIPSSRSHSTPAGARDGAVRRRGIHVARGFCGERGS